MRVLRLSIMFLQLSIGFFIVGCWRQPLTTTMSTDRNWIDKYERKKVRTVVSGDWTMETWKSSSSYVRGHPIRLGFDLKDRRNLEQLPKVLIHIVLRNAETGEVTRQARREISFRPGDGSWRGYVEDAFAEQGIIPAGEYLLDIEVIVENTSLIVRDTPIAIKENTGGY